jgi:hypothetical protein
LRQFNRGPGLYHADVIAGACQNYNKEGFGAIMI